MLATRVIEVGRIRDDAIIAATTTQAPCQSLYRVGDNFRKQTEGI
jgi:hypothetical protein